MKTKLSKDTALLFNRNFTFLGGRDRNSGVNKVLVVKAGQKKQVGELLKYTTLEFLYNELNHGAVSVTSKPDNLDDDSTDKIQESHLVSNVGDLPEQVEDKSVDITKVKIKPEEFKDKDPTEVKRVEDYIPPETNIGSVKLH